MLPFINFNAIRPFLQNFNRQHLIGSAFTFIFLLSILAISNPPVLAQGPVNGGFEGRVTDKNDAPLAGAVVQFTNNANGSQTAKKTDQNGYFRQDTLQSGIYLIRVTLGGYIPKEKSQNLFATRSNELVPVPIVLEKEAVAVITNPDNPQPVTTPSPIVTPVAPTITQQENVTSDTDVGANLNPRRGEAFNENEVRTLPLGGTTLTRTFDELALLVPGVAPPPQAIGNSVGPGVGGGVGTSGQFAVNGLRSRANNFTVDGSDNNDEDIGVRRQGFFTLVPQPIESIQEFQIITLLAPAQFGRNLGAQVNALSKSGGNQFHGAIFGLANADFLNAHNFFDNADGDTTTTLQGIRLDETSIPVFVDGQPVQVTNGAGEKDTFSLLQGGFAIGGPIVRNKLFFFASGEGQHLDGTNERHFAVPTVEQRGLFGSGAQGLFGEIKDGTVPLFPTNLVSDAVFSLFPFANDPTGIYGRNTFTKALSTDARGVILSGKVDYTLFQNTERPQTLTARYNYTDDKRDLTDVGGALFSAIRPLVRTDNFSTYLTGGLTNNVSNEFRFSYGRTRLRFEELRDDFLRPVRSLNSSEDTRFLLNAPYLSNFTIARCPGDNTPCAPSDIIFPSQVDYVSSQVFFGIPNITTENSDLGYVGQVIIGGFSSVGVDIFNFPQARKNDTFQFADTLRWQFNAGGQHSLALGTDIRRTFLDSDLPRNSRPLITFFGGRCNQDILICRNGFAQPLDFVAAGAATGFFQSLVLPEKDAKINLSYNQLNFFAQDEWRAARNLTFNFGLRYELNTTPKEADRKIEETFGIAPPSYLSGLSQFIDGRTNIYESDRDNFAPRLGFAYAPTSNTVIRGGFGMYYDQILGAVVSQSRNVFPTFTTANFGGGVLIDNNGAFTLFNPRDAIFDPANGFVCNFGDLFAGRPIPCGDPRDGGSIYLIHPGPLNTINPALTTQQLRAALQNLFLLFPSNEDVPGSSFGATLPTRKLNTPLSYQYSIGVEHNLLGNTFLSVAYVGTTGRSLLRFTTPNLGGNYIAQIDDLSFDVESCLKDIGFCQVSGIGSTNSPSRPVANVGSINQFETTGKSRYDSLQIGLRGRLSQSFQYRASYVYGKVKDDVSDVFDLAGAFALPQNSLTFAGEYAPANFDVRHRFTYSFIYDLPELKNQNNTVRQLLGGWQIAGTGKFNTGQPFTVNSIYDVNLDGNLTDRLNTTRSITETGSRRQPLALADNVDPTTLLADFCDDGAVPRNSFRAGSILDLDLSFIKRFKIREGQNLQVRTDIFNFINRANFGIPVRFLEAPGFGQATDTITPGRRIQFAVKYLF
ncbi:hypothetical protein BH18ACI1_BH18ACI1_13980 [soil metagenome]